MKISSKKAFWFDIKVQSTAGVFLISAADQVEFPAAPRMKEERSFSAFFFKTEVHRLPFPVP